jgi:hypothetical protein
MKTLTLVICYFSTKMSKVAESRIANLDKLTSLNQDFFVLNLIEHIPQAQLKDKMVKYTVYSTG